MNHLIKALLLLLICFCYTPYLYALKIEPIKSFINEKGDLQLIFNIKDFPVQELILSLKRQKEPIQILYEVELYKKGFFRDELLNKTVYYQRAGYEPERNLYFLEDNYSLVYFEKPEELLQKMMNLPALPIPNIISYENKKDLHCLIRLSLKYKAHLDKRLRYTDKEREVHLKITKKYVPF